MPSPNDAMGILETPYKATGKLAGLNDLMGKTGNWALDGAMEHLGPFDDAMGKLEALVIGNWGSLMT